MAETKLHRLLLLCLLSPIVQRARAVSAASESAHLFGLLSRDDQRCQNDEYRQCEGNFPGNFCCEQGATCMALNGGKSALCCPSGRDCSVIGTISCDVQQQNATSHPLSQLFTTDLSASLQKCGDLCCPAGMACQGDSQCAMPGPSSSSSSSAAASTSKAPSPTSSLAAAAKTTPSSPTQSSGGSKSSNTSSTQMIAASSRCNQFATPGLLVGFFSGLAAGVIATILCICCIGRTRSHKKRDSGDLSTLQASIGDPIYAPDAAGGYRTDFLRRGSGPSRTSRASSKVKSFFSSRASTTQGGKSPGTLGPKTPKTPSMKREPSMESIKIYSPPNLGGSERPTTGHTTFGQMLADAGFKPGEPYLGSPGRVDGRARKLDL